MFGQGDKAVADGQQQAISAALSNGLRAGSLWPVANSHPSSSTPAESESGHHQRRPAGDADGDGEIGRAPNDIQRKQRPISGNS